MNTAVGGGGGLNVGKVFAVEVHSRNIENHFPCAAHSETFRKLFSVCAVQFASRNIERRFRPLFGFEAAAARSFTPDCSLLEETTQDVAAVQRFILHSCLLSLTGDSRGEQLLGRSGQGTRRQRAVASQGQEECVRVFFFLGETNTMSFSQGRCCQPLPSFKHIFAVNRGGGQNV